MLSQATHFLTQLHLQLQEAGVGGKGEAGQLEVVLTSGGEDPGHQHQGCPRLFQNVSRFNSRRKHHLLPNRLGLSEA